MKTALRYAIVFLGTLSIAAAQQSTVKRNVNLRSDPSRENPAIELLQVNSTLTVLDPTPQNGYYHVRAGDGQEGWVWGKNISLETGGTSTPAPSPTQPTPPEGTKAGPAALYPDPVRTPGVANPDITQDNIADNICNQNWSTKSIRPPVSYTGPLKRQQMGEYGDTASDPSGTCMLGSDNSKCYEEDHLISLENGGHPRDPKNLWPEPYNTTVNGKIVGAHQKDIVESFIHDEICFAIPNGKRNSKIPAHVSITLQRGQEILARDWYACYLSIQQSGDCQ